MQRFAHDGVDIAFLDEGEGAPIVLVHGFASTAQVNWVYPGWVATLTGAGRRVIALDNRGHGSSSKLRDPAAYHSARMAEDVRALLDHLDLGRADVMGYSMGARIAAFFALAHPQRLNRVVFGGLGMHLVDGVGLPESIAAALEAPSLADVHDPMGRTFRTFAEQTKSDLMALAAGERSANQVRAIASWKLDQLKMWLTAQSRFPADENRRAFLFYAIEQIKRFQEDPKKMNLTKPNEPPDGQPIGTDRWAMADRDWCDWR